MTVKFAPAALSVSTTCVGVPIVVEVKVDLQVATIALPMVTVVHVIPTTIYIQHNVPAKKMTVKLAATVVSV